MTDHNFTGQKRDATGLLYYQARYYDPAVGQFLSPDTIVPDATNLFDYNRYMYVRGRVMNMNDPTGHCAMLEDGNPDLQGDNECWGLAYSIYGYGATGSNSFVSDWNIGADQWLKDIATQPFATVDYLTPFADRYESEWRGKVGLTDYEPNQVPPLSGSLEELTQQLLLVCPSTFQGVCGVSTGINGAWRFAGGRSSVEAYLDDEGNRLYTWTIGGGPQLSLRPLPRVSGSNSYILAPAAKLDDFLGPFVSFGGSGTFIRGGGGDILVGSGGVVGVSLSSQQGYNAEAHIFVTYSGLLFDSRR